ncbi:MAG: O-antigen polysaccharide polymerase Wzy [Nevskiales bacterium]|nr:O-antigen polysaccharide polymerase Wzy [Nevskiales bacterium]
MFVIANATFALVLLGGMFAGSPVAATYLMLLFLVCTMPLLFGDVPHGRFVILLVFMPLYFLHFGLADLMAVFFLADIAVPRGRIGNFALTGGEIAILVGGAMLVFGYGTAAAALRRRKAQPLAADWRMPTIILLGLTGWMLGGMGTWTFQFSGTADLNRSGQYGWGMASGLVFLNMLQQVGIALLIYAAVVQKRMLTLALMIVVFAVNFFIGFLGDSKLIALQPLILFIAGCFLIEGRIPKVWLAAACVLVVATYSVFVGYREVLHGGGLSREKALGSLSKNLDKALKASTAGEGRIENSLHGLTARLDLKPMVETIVQRTGHTVPYQDGKTIAILFYAFIPRIFVDKPATSIGRVFNREFGISSSPDTYIAPSQLGELYWNFGWAGVIVGMFVIGAVLGTTGTLFNLARCTSVARLLVVLTTFYVLCFRFEGGIGQQYTLWLRYLAIIVLLHLLFKKRRPALTPDPGSPGGR